MAVEYEKQEQRLVASQVRMVRGHKGVGGGGTEPKRGVMTIGRKKAGTAEKRAGADVTGWHSVKFTKGSRQCDAHL